MFTKSGRSPFRPRAAWGMLDSETMLCEGQLVTVVGDTPSTNVYAAANAVLGDMGQTGENIWLRCKCSTAATSGGAATLQAVLQDSPDNATWTDRSLGPVQPLANLVAGATIYEVQPPPGLARYVRVVWRVAAAALTAGAFDAYFSNTLQRNIPQPSGFAVS